MPNRDMEIAKAIRARYERSVNTPDYLSDDDLAEIIQSYATSPADAHPVNVRLLGAAKTVCLEWRRSLYINEFVKDLEEAIAAAEQQQAVCQCSLRTKLVGDGCSVCNPEYAEDHEDEES